jgi:CheY-like chemotaxis protein
MSMVDDVAPHLPYLRRYARALTGAQRSGDAYVRAALEALAAGERELEADFQPKVALYRLFQVVWGETGGKLDVGAAPDARGPGARLLRITPASRQALLLTAMEGFTMSATAQIMGASPEEVEDMVSSAQAEIDEDLATQVLIIEDEPVIAVDLENLVRSLGHSVTSVARTRSEAVAAAQSRKPGLVLADIQLADGSSGIDAVKDILGEHDVPVIFITAYPERLLTGERPEPTYLITKPFLPGAVKVAVGQALFFHDSP